MASPARNKKLHCPSCLELPDDKVYQCPEGHPVCAQCLRRLQNCTQCEKPFGATPERCRFFEFLLAEEPRDCPFKDDGCTKPMIKDDLEKHLEVCRYQPIPICSWMSMSDGSCDFASVHPAMLVKHLEEHHEAKRSSFITWSNFLETFDKPKLQFSQMYIHDTGVSSWGGWLDTEYFVTFVKLTFGMKGSGHLSCVTVLFDQSPPENKYTVELSLKDSQQNLICKWIGSPTYFKDAFDDITDSPFRTSVTYIISQALKREKPDFDINLTIDIKRISASGSWLKMF